MSYVVLVVRAVRDCWSNLRVDLAIERDLRHDRRHPIYGPPIPMSLWWKEFTAGAALANQDRIEAVEREARAMVNLHLPLEESE